MKIIVDTREKPRAIAQILTYFEQNGIEYEKRKLNTGDYMREDKPLLTVDRKQNLGEVANNLTNDNGRFMREVRRASESGQKLIVLVEHGGRIKTLTDVHSWQNPIRAKHPEAIDGRALLERMHRVSVMYGVEWWFCDKSNTGAEIVRALNA